ncbi:MAG: ABC transporter ATP-binding protein [Clostridia bacterium]|nr:ABC transporter ATP-binding protein [Clostridia bacterium]
MKKVIIDSLKNYKWRILIQIILLGVNIYLLTYPPKIIGQIVDMLYDLEPNKQRILNSIYFLLIVCVVMLVVRITWKYIDCYINRGFEKDIKIDLFKRFMKLKLKDIQNIKNGEIMSYFVKDTNEIRSAAFRILSHGVRITFTFIIAFFQMVQSVNLYLSLAVMLPIIIGAFLVVKIKKYVEKSFKKSQEMFTNMSEYIQESTDSIRTTKAYSCKNEQIREFLKKNRRVYQSNNTVDIFSNLLKLALNICFGFCYGIALLYGSKLVLDGTITVGELVTFNGFIVLFVGPVSWLPQLISSFKRAQISYKRLEKIYDLKPERINEKVTLTKEKLEGHIIIKDLNFSYPGIIDGTLQDINIEIKKGETLGIIGTIGSGKTTLMNLLTRLYSVPDGIIFIDGKDINEIPIRMLRNNICYITQDNFLFSSTLKDNISLFKEEYDDDEIKESTKKAIVYEDIRKMPKGINTVIGERGGDLSGGQKQRVAISRAFLKDSSILIFDDTFSALDNNTSEKLIENIKELSDEKTCIIISNKVSDVKYSDKIIVLDNGRIVEKGVHEELIRNKGIYNEFYNQQSSKSQPSFLD